MSDFTVARDIKVLKRVPVLPEQVKEFTLIPPPFVQCWDSGYVEVSRCVFQYVVFIYKTNIENTYLDTSTDPTLLPHFKVGSLFGLLLTGESAESGVGGAAS